MRYVFLPKNEYVKVYGRTIMLDDCRLLCTSASGVEFSYTGTFLKVTFFGDSSIGEAGSDINWCDIARVAVFVDGNLILDTTIKKECESYVILEDASLETAQEHVVRIVKLSEPRMSSVAVGAIEVEACKGPVPTEDNEKMVEFIGDSITCGYGIDTMNELCRFSTGTENVTKAYAYISANKLGLDFSMVSYSGHGFVSGYTPDPDIPKPEELIQPYYEIVSYSYNTFRGISPSEYKWDFERKADIIVINIGTNDYSYTQNDEGKISQYEGSYIDFLSLVRRNNPNAHIICSIGIMGDELFPAIERVVAKYMDATKDENISTLKFDVQDPETDGYSADSHPSAGTQEKASVKMAEELEKWLA